MATLTFKNTGATIPLLAHHTIGRRADLVDTVINRPQISKIHAVIEWKDSQWLVRHLGGRNGTELNSSKLTSGSTCTLAEGDILVFAQCDEYRLVVTDLAPPQNLLFGLNNVSPTTQLETFNLLPNDNHPKAAVYFCGQSLNWKLEIYETDTNESHTLQPRQPFAVGPYSWMLHIQPESMSTTQLKNNNIDMQGYAFIFRSSQNLEHVTLNLLNKELNEVINLGERSHHQVLLHLAAKVIEDHKQGIAASECGWIQNELLSRELGLELSHINILLYRARKQILNALPGVYPPQNLIQRRRGEVRFSHTNMEIFRNGIDISNLSMSR